MRRSFVLLIGACALAGCAHMSQHAGTSQPSQDRWPPAFIFEGIDEESVVKNLDTLQPWKAGDPLPTSFQEAGLEMPVDLVAGSMYLDGGSQCYLFRGANNKYLSVCTDVYATTLYLGVYHFSHKKGTVVPWDSDCERFLSAAIESAVAKLDKQQNQPPKPTPG